MRLLDRYLLRELLVPLGYCLGGFQVFWISADLISNLDNLKEDGMATWDILLYQLFKTPESLMIVMPVALLLALLYALTNHARHQELTAIRAAGWSVWRLSLPYLIVGLLVSALVFLLNEHWLPESSLRAEILRTGATAGTASGRAWKSDVKFRNDRERRFWWIHEYNINTGEMRDPYVDWLLPDGAQTQLLAEHGAWSNGVWRFQNVRVLVPPQADSPLPVQRRLAELAMPEFSETPDQIRSHVKISQLSSSKAARRVRLTLNEILHYQALHPELGPEERAILDTQLHARLAAPWTGLVVVLIAIPFAARSGRRNVFVGVSCSILICFLYYLVQQLTMGFGTTGRLPPWIAAWLPNLSFGLTGVVLTFRVR